MERKAIRKLAIWAVICMLVVMVKGTSVKAAESKINISGDYQYKVLEDGTVSITKYIGKSSIVKIPETLGGKKVTVIGQMAFYNNLSINVVYFPDSIREVDMYTFARCWNLKEVYLNQGLKRLGDSSFLDCDLGSIKVPNTVVNMEGKIFADNKRLIYAEISQGLLEVGDQMFRGCSLLEYIKIGDSVKSTGKASLDSCISFNGFVTQKIPRYESEFLIIPSQIEMLNSYNFINCSNIKKIVVLNDDSLLGYEFVPKGTIIYGHKNSVAERYAAIYEYQFIEFVQTKQITLSKTKLNLELGGNDATKLTVNYTPSNTTIKEVVWSSSNSKVATVDKSGNIKAVSNGMAVISARTFDESNLKQECKVTVTTRPKDISLNKKELYLDLSSTKSAKLTVKPQPAQATLGNVVWKSTNPKVATVSNNGKVKAKGVGKAKVTATVNGKTKTCTVYVAPKQMKKLKVSAARINRLTLSWEKVKQASGYKIYAYNEKSRKYILVKNCSSKTTSYAIKKINGKKLASAKGYKFRVCPYVKIGNKKVKGSYSYIKGSTLPQYEKHYN